MVCMAWSDTCTILDAQVPCILEKSAERRLSADRPENKHCNVYKSCYTRPFIRLSLRADRRGHATAVAQSSTRAVARHTASVTRRGSESARRESASITATVRERRPAATAHAATHGAGTAPQHTCTARRRCPVLPSGPTARGVGTVLVRATSRGAARGRHDLTSTAPAPRDATRQDGGRAAGDSQSETTTLNALACTYHNDQHGYRTSTKYRGRPCRGGREHPREREECQEFRVTASRAQGPEHSLQPALDDLP